MRNVSLYLGFNEAALSLIEAMDLNVDPCQDFYQYACGGWIKKNPIPQSKSRWSQIDILRDRLINDLKIILEQTDDARDPRPLNSARVMYKACMNTRAIQNLGLKPLIDVLENYGGWPMTKSFNEEIHFDWKAVTASLRTSYRISYFISVYNDMDNYDTEQSSIYIDQGSLSLPLNILLNPGDHPKIIAAYFAYVSGSAKAIRDALGSGGATDDQIDSDVQDLLQFEIELAKIVTRAEARRDSSRMYNPMLLTEIQSWTNGFSSRTHQAQMDWFEYINQIYSTVNVSISTHERIIVVEKEYLKNLFAILDRKSTRVVANYIMWRLVRLLSPETNSKMNSLAISFSKALYGNPQSDTRSNSCANEVNSVLGFAVGAKYIEQHFQANIKTQVKQMITYLKATFVTLITEADWMDDATKAIAKEKVDAMIELVGFPDWITKKRELEAYYYDGLEISISDHFKNIQNVNVRLTRDGLQSLRRKTNRTRWITFPSIVNAFYAPKYNSISFPAGILQPPYFGLNGRSAAMNYGGIGVVIGHEITHGFDDKGRQNDKYGNTVQWWTENTLQQYLSRAQCFIQKYNEFTVLNGTRLNGITTLGENMADYGGIREAYVAYRNYVAANGVEPPLPGLEQFTSEQIFFITFANTHCSADTPEKLLNQVMNDPHSPSRYRVIGTLSNSEDFVREFNCPPDSPMNRLNKCLLWR
ncbi:hypothetical protein DAPPUDRAFT_199694 [Daphnia pulex]|uniref:Uncharacterized protein n=1 Tax=Daphnia pulex TaxID=6669 RepID=E9H0B2_DAPPU|nr:hypothetical protein DAPPUDRAFT_199694 [Daphnia pulex]|eukprot:EFX74773.1 hypothetical protein DAPPUDRAFT_199694 [Daphnia pulex]